jgi:hypothetical protein
MTPCTVCQKPAKDTRCHRCERVARSRFWLAATPIGKVRQGVKRVASHLYKDVGMSVAVRAQFADVHNPTASDLDYFSEENATWGAAPTYRRGVPKGLLVFASYL